MPRSTTIRRVGTGALVLLAVGVLLVAYALVQRQRAVPVAGGAPTTSKVLLDENFDGGTLDTAVFNTCHWWADGGCTIASNDELEWYVPEQVKVSDGALQLTAEPHPVRGTDGKPYDFRSGMVTTGPPAGEGDPPAKLAFTYGTVEARLRAPAGQGLWPAMWLLPATRESRPEIDVLEMIGSDPGELIMHLHPQSRRADSPSKRYRLPGADLASDWHTIRLDWAPDRLDFFVDGTRVWRVTGKQVPNEPMYLLFNLAVGGVYPGPPDDTTPFPATFAIDYLRITAA